MTTQTPPTIVLPDEASVVNIGLPLFADAVRDQAIPVQHVDWRIPADGDLELVAALEQLCGVRSAGIEEANNEVVRRLDRGVPLLVDIAAAETIVPGMSGQLLLHCGPAIEWTDVCDPLRRSMRAATVAEGWAENVEQADRPPHRRHRTARARLPSRHGDADGKRDRTLGAGVRRRQP